MDRIEQSIDVNMPIATVYDLWTDFESFPQFMEGVKEVRRSGAKELHWVAEIAGKTKEWKAEVLDEVEDERISWRSTSGAPNNGTVTFEDLGGRTRILLVIEYEPEAGLENIGSKLGVVDARVAGDLKRFRDYAEKRPADAPRRSRRESGRGATRSRTMGSRRRATSTQSPTGRTRA